MEYIITRASIVNRCNTDGNYYLFFTEKERPCEEAYLKEITDIEGNKCSRYFINLNDSISELDKLGEKYNSDILVTKNADFPNYIALMIYDEELLPVY